MPPQPEAPSKIVPSLNAAVVADTGAIDPTTNKKSLIGIFTRLYGTVFPVQRPVMLYFRITDAEGHYQLKVQFLLLGAEEQLLADLISPPIHVADRNGYTDFLVPTPPLPFPSVGRYEFRLLANDVHVGGLCIEVQPPPTPKKTQP